MMLKKYKAAIREEAKQDFQELLFWYSEKDPSLPNRLKIDFKQIITSITSYPFAHTIRYDEIRIALLKIFPVNVHYYIDAERALVIVIGIYHEASNPEKWIHRLND